MQSISLLMATKERMLPGGGKFFKMFFLECVGGFFVKGKLFSSSA